MKQTSGDSIKVTQSLFQESDGGSIPTSPLQLEISRIKRKEAEECYEKWHYLGKTGFISTIDYGVKTNGSLWGCISYGSPNAKVMRGLYDSNTQYGWWEIKRLALSDFLPKNSESRTIGVSLRMLRKEFDVKGVISYADSGVGHTGIIYKASGFQYKGLTAQKSDFFEEGHDRPKQRGEVVGLQGEWKERTRKHLYVKIF